MHPLPTATPHTSKRLRPAAARLAAGSSSLLRLSRAAEARLPSGAALSGWAERAAAMLDLTPMMVGPLTQAAGAAPQRHEPPSPGALREVQA